MLPIKKVFFCIWQTVIVLKGFPEWPYLLHYYTGIGSKKSKLGDAMLIDEVEPLN